MKVSILAILALILASLACTQVVLVIPTPAPSATAVPSATPTARATATAKLSTQDAGQDVVSQTTVNVRAEPDTSSAAVGALVAGDTVSVLQCSEFWCAIEHPFEGYVWRGCLSEVNTGDLGCSAK